jgi:hypothetical protein
MSVIGSSKARKEHYEQMALEAEAIAMTAIDPVVKQEYFQIASAWRRLAQHAMSQNQKTESQE